jgi:hypothetical protein
MKKAQMTATIQLARNTPSTYIGPSSEEEAKTVAISPYKRSFYLLVPE